MKKKKEKNPLNKLFVSELGEPFYLNVIQFSNEGKWYPTWYSEWAGKTKRGEAVRLRKELSSFLHNEGNKEWKDGKNIKTVKITLFK